MFWYFRRLIFTPFLYFFAAASNECFGRLGKTHNTSFSPARCRITSFRLHSNYTSMAAVHCDLFVLVSPCRYVISSISNTTFPVHFSTNLPVMKFLVNYSIEKQTHRQTDRQTDRHTLLGWSRLSMPTRSCCNSISFWSISCCTHLTLHSLSNSNQLKSN